MKLCPGVLRVRFPHEHAESVRLRSYVLLILVMESLGIAAELVLSGHTADFWQWVPLALIGAFLMVMVWMRLSRSGTERRFAHFRSSWCCSF
jgi:hypothetical protein